MVVLLLPKKIKVMQKTTWQKCASVNQSNMPLMEQPLT